MNNADRRWVERAVIIILNVLLAGSIVTYFWFPQLTVKSTDAGIYTGMFQGQERMQGLFSGPFHVALAALLLIGWAIVRMRTDRLLATASLLLAGAGGYLCLVRTFYAALALMLVVFVLVSPNWMVGIRRAATIVGLGSALLVSTLLFPNLSRLGDIASTILNFETDDRFTNRFRRYATAADLIETSPVFGWGPGSAGDTLLFPSGYQHVTAHNIVLKLMVEGGLIGIVLWGGLVASLIVFTRRKSSWKQLSALALTALFTLGLTVSAIDTLPVSFLIFVLCGLACEARNPRIAQTVRPLTAARFQAH
ncbi:O-antigen ligase family protein [Mycolicibacterium mengxianglii]|uniref:O-antigen ligase family protein n=1 Tax=Mycolicibacterium mengxianglii TaxID=2736649 RepID=UPI0018D074E7|nr:O-antigen ligase family protein [Mycolicibacterium mengxianglii]